MSKEEFLSVYERQQASGLTIKDFCENETYSSSCFHYWKKKFGLSRTYTSHPDRVPDDTFIPLGLHRRGNLPSSTSGDVTIDLPSGIKIHLDSRGNPELTFGLIHILCDHVLSEWYLFQPFYLKFFLPYLINFSLAKELFVYFLLVKLDSGKRIFCYPFVCNSVSIR